VLPDDELAGKESMKSELDHIGILVSNLGWFTDRLTLSSNGSFTWREFYDGKA
jgi:hypothetical protein